MPLLKVCNLTKKYNDQMTAVNKISFTLEKGETLGILGTNGAGKTTTIHMLLGLLTPTSGSISYFGKNFFNNRSESLQKVGFGTTYARLPGRLTVTTNLDIYGRLYGLSQTQRTKKIHELLERLNIWELRDRACGELSAGEATRIVLAKAFIADPKIVLLDEPTASLDVDVAQDIRNFICAQRDAGVSFLFTSHNMHEMTHVCDRIIVMQKGKIIEDSTPEKLSRTISCSYLQLIVGKDHLQKSIAYAEEKKIPYQAYKISITFEIDEQKVTEILMDIAQRGITYTEISIKKPSLEDYFLSLSRTEQKGKTS